MMWNFHGSTLFVCFEVLRVDVNVSLSVLLAPIRKNTRDRLGTSQKHKRQIGDLHKLEMVLGDAPARSVGYTNDVLFSDRCFTWRLDLDGHIYEYSTRVFWKLKIEVFICGIDAKRWCCVEGML